MAVWVYHNGNRGFLFLSFSLANFAVRFTFHPLTYLRHLEQCRMAYLLSLANPYVVLGEAAHLIVLTPGIVDVGPALKVHIGSV